jgi:hypothetical protein
MAVPESSKAVRFDCAPPRCFASRQSRLNWLPPWQTHAVSPTFVALEHPSPRTCTSSASSRSSSSPPATGATSMIGSAPSRAFARTPALKIHSSARSPRRGIPNCRLNRGTGGFGPGCANGVERSRKPSRSDNHKKTFSRPLLLSARVPINRSEGAPIWQTSQLTVSGRSAGDSSPASWFSPF